MSLFTTRPKAKYTIREVEIDLYLLPADKARQVTNKVREYEKKVTTLSEDEVLEAMNEFIDILIEYSQLTKEDVVNNKDPELSLTYSEIFELIGALVGYSVTPLAPRPRS